MNREEILDNAAQAQSLLDQPAFKKAFSDLENAITEQWKACPLRDKDGAHELKLMFKLLRDLRANLEQAISAGKLEEVALEREKNPRPFLGMIHGRNK